jgi:hypothetical protein
MSCSQPAIAAKINADGAFARLRISGRARQWTAPAPMVDKF